jgi:hypothetical protein
MGDPYSINYDEIDPGMRRFVRLLRNWGWGTFSSNDEDDETVACVDILPTEGIDLMTQVIMLSTELIALGIPLEDAELFQVEGAIDGWTKSSVIRVLGVTDRVLEEVTDGELPSIEAEAEKQARHHAVREASAN